MTNSELVAASRLPSAPTSVSAREPGALVALPTAPVLPSVVPSPASVGERHTTLFWVASAVGLLLAGSLRFLYFYLDDLTRDHTHTFVRRVLEEATGNLTAGLVYVGIVWLESRYPVTRAAWRRSLPIHAVGAVVFSGLHTALMAATRAIVFPLAGQGPYDYGRMPMRYFMELPNDVIGYASVLLLLFALHTWKALRDRELRGAELERALAQAQLRNLQLRLQPHFLFNALNTISARMYEDPAGADAMMGQLGELLRHSLRAPHAQEVPLSEEIALLENYVAIMRARFGPSLDVAIEVEAGLADAAVPAFLLQPLVENAIRHGAAPRGGRARIDVRARRDSDMLELDVMDDGPGAPPPGPVIGRGVGLATTGERLSLLYGRSHAFAAGNHPGGGFRVTMRIPLHATVSDAVPLLS